MYSPTTSATLDEAWRATLCGIACACSNRRSLSSSICATCFQEGSEVALVSSVDSLVFRCLSSRAAGCAEAASPPTTFRPVYTPACSSEQPHYQGHPNDETDRAANYPQTTSF